MKNASQLSIFDLETSKSQPHITVIDLRSKTELSAEIKERLNNYNLDLYIEDLNSLGLSKTWEQICEYVLTEGEQEGFLAITNFGEMYEIGLAIQDKILKKNNGQYYTPEDVASVMGNWLLNCEGENVCDVACGTGKLILTYLDLIGFEKAQALLNAGRVYLYDFDCVALKICKTALVIKYKIDKPELIHDVCCDFLNRGIELPDNCKVISNPPYAGITTLGDNWTNSEIQRSSKELYSCFMEKIITQSKSSVIITPYSFIGGSKFYSLRRLMNSYSGFIVSFDNVPGNIFCGRKHGIFNTNTANSVRAAITVVDNKIPEKGFKLTPLIRFKNIERDALLNNDKLSQFIDEHRQLVSDNDSAYKKVDSRLYEIYSSWIGCSDAHLSDYVVNGGKYKIYMPNTCRYYTTASAHEMSRSGQLLLEFDDKDVYNFVYCLISSSFVYWHWRIYDGGINYPKSLLLNMPVFYSKTTDSDKQFFAEYVKKMSMESSNFIIHKNNVGIQENVKFPKEYRNEINSRMLKIIGSDSDCSLFDYIHSNMALEVNCT